MDEKKLLEDNIRLKKENNELSGLLQKGQNVRTFKYIESLQTELRVHEELIKTYKDIFEDYFARFQKYERIFTDFDVQTLDEISMRRTVNGGSTLTGEGDATPRNEGDTATVLPLQ